MRKMLNLCGLALASTLAACGSETPSATNASAERDMNAIMTATSPFGDAEIAMNEAMMKAVGVNAGDNWVRKMIEHHKGAVAISRQVLTMNPETDVLRLARQTIDKQTTEIAALEKLVTQGAPDPASAELYVPAMDRMHQAMMGAAGASLSETFYRKMLAHHKGAVEMSNVALANGVAGAVRAAVERTKAEQQNEAGMLEAMLAGKPMTHGAATPAASAAGSPRKPAPAVKPAPAAKTPQPAPDPHAGMDMTNMQ